MRLDNRRYYDEFSVSYERHRHSGYHAFIDDLESSLVRRYVTPNSTILEAGCGTGLVLSRIAPHVKRAIGVDLSGGMLRQAHQRQLDVGQGSVTALPFADASFDMVCSFKVLAHVEAITVAMSELSRVLRPGGFLCTEFYNTRSLRYLIKRLQQPTHIAAADPTIHDEAVFTRYDSLETVKSYLPSDLQLETVYGLRVLTPMPALHKLPIVAPVLQGLERTAAELPGLRGLGGFMLIVARKNPA